MRSSKHIDRQSAQPSSDARDRQLLGAVAIGDRQMMAELYNGYFPRVFKFVYRLTGDYGLTEEVVNDVMLIVWKTADQFRGSSKVSTWVLGIAYRQCMKRLRKRRLPRVSGDHKPELERERGCTDGSIERDDMITKALHELSPEHRVMIESVLYLGMTYREVAELAACPVNTAKTRVHNARKKLQATLTRMGYRYGDYCE